MAVAPDGKNINLNCGSLHLEALQKRVTETGADLGIAFDGDADRALFIAGSGKVVDGDAVLFLAGSALKRAGKLPGNLIVATVMSNLGLEKALGSRGISMLRTPVGDKYVLEEMLRRGAVLGGEQSGHVIFSEFATTGDGLLTALRVLEIVRDSGRSLDALTDEIKTFPQKLVNVRVKNKRPLAELDSVQAEIQAAENAFNGTGRVLVRFSGTEPLARVMIEAASDDEVEKCYPGGVGRGRIRASQGNIHAQHGAPDRCYHIGLYEASEFGGARMDGRRDPCLQRDPSLTGLRCARPADERSGAHRKEQRIHQRPDRCSRENSNHAAPESAPWRTRQPGSGPSPSRRLANLFALGRICHHSQSELRARGGAWISRRSRCAGKP
jgi:hypothetical protein